jgi:hypothetical protein
MDTLALKLAATPTLIMLATLAGRRFGNAIGGWVVALPLTSGPIALFLALDQGPEFARLAATGALAGAAAQALYCLAYAWLAGRLAWPAAVMLALFVFGLGGLFLQQFALPLWAVVVGVVALLLAVLRLMPREATSGAPAPPPAWDLPARMLVATAVVVGLTAAAPALGPHLSGLLATFPVFASVLAVFAHRSHGGAAARQVLWGMVSGLFGFAAFFAAVGALVARAGIAPAFVLGVLAALATHGIGYALMHHEPPPGPID